MEIENIEKVNAILFDLKIIESQIKRIDILANTAAETEDDEKFEIRLKLDDPPDLKEPTTEPSPLTSSGGFDLSSAAMASIRASLEARYPPPPHFEITPDHSTSLTQSISQIATLQILGIILAELTEKRTRLINQINKYV